MCCVPNSGNRIGDRDGAANHAPRAAADAVPGACRGPDRIVRSRQQQCSGQAARLAPDGTAAALPNSGRRLFRIPSRVGDINVGDPFNAPPTSGRRLSRAGWAATTPSRLAERDQRNPANAAGRHHLGTAFERSRLPTHYFLPIVSCSLLLADCRPADIRFHRQFIWMTCPLPDRHTNRVAHPRIRERRSPCSSAPAFARAADVVVRAVAAHPTGWSGFLMPK